jgi:hypothetical protein
MFYKSFIKILIGANEMYLSMKKYDSQFVICWVDDSFYLQKLVS